MSGDQLPITSLTDDLEKFRADRRMQENPQKEARRRLRETLQPFLMTYVNMEDETIEKLRVFFTDTSAFFTEGSRAQAATALAKQILAENPSLNNPQQLDRLINNLGSAATKEDVAMFAAAEQALRNPTGRSR